MRRIAALTALVLAMLATGLPAEAQVDEPNIRVTSQRPDSRVKGVSRRLIFSTAQGEARPTRVVRVRNIGNADLTVTEMSVSGANASRFTIEDSDAADGFTLQPGGHRDVPIEFTPNATGYGRYSAQLTTDSNDSNAPEVVTQLKAIHAEGYEEELEPTLFSILSTIGFEPTGLPETNLNLGNVPYEDEVQNPYWRPYNPAFRVAMVPLARYSTVIPDSCCPAGWFERTPAKTKHRIQRFSGGDEATGQNQRTLPLPGSTPTLTPLPDGTNITTFVPTSSPGNPGAHFGLYSGDDMSDNTAKSMRFFRARRSDRGTVYPHIWIVAEDQGASPVNGGSVVRNYDHNDFVWLLINAVPA
jgi:hypothetical protein